MTSGADAPDPAGHFQTGAANYAAFRPTWPAGLAAALAALAPHRGLAVDAGCGTGQLTVQLGDEFDRVIGADISAAQLAAAVRHPRVEYRLAQAEALPVDDGSAALITAAQAAHWFDLPVFYEQVRRAASPGGVLALLSYGPIVVEGALGPRFARFYHDGIAPYWPPERVHVETGYRRLPFPFDPLPLADFQIVERWSHARLWGYVDSWSAARAPGAAQVIEDARADCALILSGDAPVTVRFPVTVRAGRVHPA